MKKYSADTHSLVWYFGGSRSLSPAAKLALEEVFLYNSASCYISNIVILEALHLSFKKNNFNFKTFIGYLKRKNVLVVSVNKEVMHVCLNLPKKLELHDRIIVATSLYTGAPLLTKDKVITRSKIKDLKTIW